MENSSLNNCQTVYPTRNNFSAPAVVVFVTVNVILTVLNITVNLFLVYALKATNQLKSISSRLIMYLSISDICVGLVVQNLVSVVLGVFKTKTNCALELSGQFFSYIFPQISGVMVMIIALDRWLHMKYLNRYSTTMNWNRARFLVIGNFVLALIIATVSIIASIYKRFFIFNAILVVTDVSVVVLTYLAYIFTFRSVRNHMASIRKRNKEGGPAQTPDATSSAVSKKKTRRRDAKLAKTMVFILTSLTACYIPYFVVGLYWSYLQFHKHTTTSQFLDTMLWCCFLLVYLNSTLNAIIFIRRNKQVYRLLKKLFGFSASFEASTTTDSSGNQNTSKL